MHNIITINNKAKKIATILIVIAIVLISYGLFLDYKQNIRLIDPVKGISTVDVNNNKSKVDIDIDSIQSDNNLKPNPLTDGSIEEKIPADITKKNETKTYSDDYDTINNRLKKQIKSEYDVDVIYGYDTKDYKVGDLATTPIEDPSVINSSLVKLEIVLGHYPDGMFREIKEGGIPLTIYLVDKFSQTGITGVTDSNAYFANISIATAYPFEESFYHESYHYIERYITEKKKIYFTSWDNLNPAGFQYTDDANPSISYAANGGDPKSYFVNNYAQSADAEDRASTFEYMMASSKAKCLNKEQPVWKKAKLISQTIDAALDTCSPSIVDYWERFL